MIVCRAECTVTRRHCILNGVQQQLSDETTLMEFQKSVQYLNNSSINSKILKEMLFSLDSITIVHMFETKND